ncbi:DUF5916 domain-containing protein [candidate division KSB1 bacterium]
MRTDFVCYIYSLLLVLISAVQVLHAQDKVYVTGRINPEPPILDGVFDDAAWQEVPWEGNFTQTKPYEGSPPSERTEFKILYSDQNLYVAIRAYDSEPDEIEYRVARRDDDQADRVGIALDSYFDHRTAFYFGITPAGVKTDGIVSQDGKVWDPNYDPVWFVEVQRNHEGWMAEMRIPLSQLRFSGNEEQVWGLHFYRVIFRKQEWSKWPFIPENASGQVHLFGQLRGIREVHSTRRVEILPYSVGKMTRERHISDNPFSEGRYNDLAGGFDGKIGITSNLTMDFTLNPDFGQVEADPSEVNLTTIETFFPEKRPFFIEGNDIFEFKDMGGGRYADDRVFYSRRIGRAPQIDPGAGDYVDSPENSSIIAAAKLTGKTSNGWSVGFVEALTQEESADISSDGLRRSEVVEPMTNYLVGRIQKDYDEGSTVIGGLLTATRRNLNALNTGLLNRSAYTGGFDFRHQWYDKTYFVDLKTVFSRIGGSETALQRIQRSPTHYFQRPDAGYAAIDSTRTSLAGHGGIFQIGKGGNGRLTYFYTGYWRSPGLNLNDIGYQREADLILQKVEGKYTVWDPVSIFRSYSIALKKYYGWYFGGIRYRGGWTGDIEAQFKNYWKIILHTRQTIPDLQARELRGGPHLQTPPTHHYRINIETDDRKKLQVKFDNFLILTDDRYSLDNKLKTDLIWRPADNVMVSVNPFYNIFRQNLQYVGTKQFAGDYRYVMGRLDQKTFGVIFRLNYSVTPDFSIQYYGQPFISAGDYARFKKITAPRAQFYDDRFSEYEGEQITYDTASDAYLIDDDRSRVVDYSFRNPDFNIREFRSNFVIRWEYNPGSVAYLVWAQDRAGRDPLGRFSVEDDMRGLFNIHPRNIFLLKLSYWFSLR